MSTTTPLPTKKRQLSEKSTPSPTLRRASKNARMNDTGEKLCTTEPQETVSFQSLTSASNSACPQLPFLKLDDFMQLNDEQTGQQMQSHFNTLSVEIARLYNENNDLKASIATANGKIHFLGNKVEKAKEKLGELEWRQLRQDIVIYNLAESQTQSDIQIFIDFMIHKLHIQPNKLHTPENPGGPIQIDHAFRLGKEINGKPRPLVVTFALHSSKMLVLEHYRKMNKATKVRITDQFPPEMKEKRAVQKETMKKYKDMYPNSEKQVKLVKDKLIVGN